MIAKTLREESKDLYTTLELEEIFGIKEEAFISWCEKGEIPCQKLEKPYGSFYAIKKDDLLLVLKKVKERRDARKRVLVITSIVSFVLFMVSMVLLAFSSDGGGGLLYLMGCVLAIFMPVLVDRLFFREFKCEIYPYDGGWEWGSGRWLSYHRKLYRYGIL